MTAQYARASEIDNSGERKWRGGKWKRRGEEQESKEGRILKEGEAEEREREGEKREGNGEG